MRLFIFNLNVFLTSLITVEVKTTFSLWGGVSKNICDCVHTSSSSTRGYGSWNGSNNILYYINILYYTDSLPNFE